MAMRLNFWICLFLLLAGPLVLSAADDKSTTFYVQLIQGTEGKSPKSGAKPIGPKLSERLAPVFRWKSYWEISQHQVKVSPGKVQKLPMTVRDLEIELQSEGKFELRLYQKGKLVRTARQKLTSDTMEILGGTVDNDNAWFVVVRREKPQ